MTNEGQRRTALVTGASAGIGRAFAELLASRGYRVILTARRRERLEALATSLEAKYKADTHVIPADLSDPAAPSDLVATIAARGLTIDFLVNNAGYGVPGSFDRVAWSTHRAFNQVMVNAVVELSYHVLPGMIDRKWGRIVNVASLAAFIPSAAGHTLYHASKAYLVRFSEALSAEHARNGVFTTALCPGFTLTEFHDVTQLREQVSKLPRWMWMDADTVALQGYQAVMSGVPVYVNGRVNRTIAWFVRMLPQSIIRRAIARTGRRYRKV